MGSVPSAVADGSTLRFTIDIWFGMLIGDPSADGTDPIQASRPIVEGGIQIRSRDVQNTWRATRSTVARHFL